MTVATAVAGTVTLVLGLSLALVGVLLFEAGRSRSGPIPFLRTPTEWELVALGAACWLLGAFLTIVGFEVVL